MTTPRVEVVCVGTELLGGKVNTHTAYIGQQLASIGLFISREHTVGDDFKIMRETFSEAFQRSDVVICAGGLGPTFDDITREAWSKVLKAPLKSDPTLVRDIAEKFKSRGLRMPPHNRRQSMVLKDARVISNPNGTAPGQLWSDRGKTVALLPGPAREMYPMFDRTVLPHLQNKFSSLHAAQKTFLICGVPESRIDEIIRPWIARRKSINGCQIVHGILASKSIISVKFSVQGGDPLKVRESLKILTADLRRLLKNLYFGEDEDTLEGVIGKKLTARRQTLATAESCTGGLIAKILTDQSGASDFFIQGLVTYHNSAKMKLLGVKASTLKKFGAVSAQTAREMAVGARKTAQTDHAISVTGIAGPAGGTPKKPVGLIYIGYAGPKRTRVKEFRFNGDRGWIRHRSALMALDLLRKEVF